MKCVKNMESGKINRMSDNLAQSLVEGNPGKWSFAPKSDWKAQAKNVAGRRKFYK
jgi:hypothetical protein